MKKNQGLESLSFLSKIPGTAPFKGAFSEAFEFGQACRFETGHARQVAWLSLLLADRLRDFCQLAEEDLLLLGIGALLHDVGCCRGLEKHHKHSRDLILENHLKSLDDGQRQLMIANIARYHRKSEPKESHRHFQLLNKTERNKVEILASLLRIADGLDREHRQKIETLQVEIKPLSLILHTDCPGNLSEEKAVLPKKSALFTRLFKKTVQLG